MSLVDVLRAGVATIDKVTGDGGIQLNITHEAWTGHDAHGAPTYAAGVTISAIVERKSRLVRLTNGELVTAKAAINIPRAIVSNGATGRHEPIDVRDKITLPDGDSGPILDTQGLYDSATNAPMFHEIFLG